MIHNIDGTPVYNNLLENKGVKNSVIPNDEDINYEIIINDGDSLESSIDPLQNKILKIEGVDKKTKEWKFKEQTWKMKEWNQKMKGWTMISYLLSEKYIAYVILPPSTTMTEEPISDPWYGST